MQQQYPSSYENQIAKIKKYEQLYRILLCKYTMCISCVYRIFGVMIPKLYSDDNNSSKLQNQILTLAENNCKKQGVKQSYSFLLGEFKVYCQSKQKDKQKQTHSPQCWLCNGILQQRFIQQSAIQIIQKIKQEHYNHKKKYKLNVKIHNLFAIKFQIFCNLILVELQKLYMIDKKIVQAIRKQLIVELFQKTGLDLKTVFKWRLSNWVNQQPAEIFTLSSTINQDQQTVIVSMEIDHISGQLQSALTTMLGPSLHLDKVKHKKGRIQLQQNVCYQANWTQSLISKIVQVNNQEWEKILQKFSIERLKKIQLESSKHIISKITLQSQNIFFCGKYLKFSRYLSQTPWVINKQRLTQSSLQEEVQKKLLRFFYPPDIPHNKIQIKFHAGGRQDIDVRMLKGGRPFVLEFLHPRNCLADISISQILQRIKTQYPQAAKNLPQIQAHYQFQQPIKCSLLQFYINASTQLAKVNSFQKTTSSYVSKQLKQAQIQKIKHYICYIKTQQQFSEEDKIKLQSCYNLPVLQKTPVRVLHRRTLMFRDKVVHKMAFHQATKRSAVLQIWASAGTYIKQFVHGDLNRTIPNVGLLLNKSVDILQLDVGSLKQGQWVQGDHQNMKIGQLPWQNKDSY